MWTSREAFACVERNVREEFEICTRSCFQTRLFFRRMQVSNLYQLIFEVRDKQIDDEIDDLLFGILYLTIQLIKICIGKYLASSLASVASKHQIWNRLNDFDINNVDNSKNITALCVVDITSSDDFI